jgi:hypothetical protein
MVFVEVADDVDGADLLAPRADDDQRTGEADALRFLFGALKDGDWHESAALKARAAERGIRSRTLERAKKDLRIEHKRDGFPSVTRWRLVTPASTRAAGASRDGAASADGYAASPPPHLAVTPVAPLAAEVVPGATSDEEAA